MTAQIRVGDYVVPRNKAELGALEDYMRRTNRKLVGKVVSIRGTNLYIYNVAIWGSTYTFLRTELRKLGKKEATARMI